MIFFKQIIPFQSNLNCIIFRKLEYCFPTPDRELRPGPHFWLWLFTRYFTSSLLSSIFFFKILMMMVLWVHQNLWFQSSWPALLLILTRCVGFRLRTTQVRKAVFPTKADTFWNRHCCLFIITFVTTFEYHYLTHIQHNL